MPAPHPLRGLLAGFADSILDPPPAPLQAGKPHIVARVSDDCDGDRSYTGMPNAAIRQTG